MAKIFIATPAFTGMTHVLYTLSLAHTATHLAFAGHETIIRIHSSGSLLIMERNSLLDAFLQTECTHILCIDSDMGWRHEAVLSMLEHDKDFVAGCYPIRKKPDTFHFQAVEKDDGSLVTEGPLVKMLYIPAGFMLIKRHVIEEMQRKLTHLNYESADPSCGGRIQCALFNTEIVDGILWGEDYVFCRHARHAGFDIWVDPRYGFNHCGTIGCLADYLTNKESEWANHKEHQNESRS